MSATVLHFSPRPDLEPQDILGKFIELCRQSDVLGAREQFNFNIWTVGWLKGKNTPHRVVFSTAEAARKGSSEPSLPSPFLEFAKAAIVYLQDKKPVVSQGPRITAFRYLEAALREQGWAANPTAVNVGVLDLAVALVQEGVSEAVAYRVAGQLEMISELMRSKGFIALRQPWLHGLKKPKEMGSRISSEALKARKEKMPSAAALRALGAIFQDAVEPRDLLIASFTALMLCAPERINEVLRLRRNCIVEGEGRFSGKVGLRWSGSKLAQDTTKWLPTQMAPLARAAIAKLLNVSGPAQRIAEWYTANPRSIYLHESAAHLRGREVLTLGDIALILWGDESAKKSAYKWIGSTARIASSPSDSERGKYKFSDVERAVLAMLPKTFPSIPGDPRLLYRDALAVCRVNESNPEKPTYLCMIDCVDYNMLTNDFGARKGRGSIFKRFGYTEEDGSPIFLRSHSLRHYLNTLAQIGGLSSAEVAIFSGRADQAQNRIYDHRTSDEVQAPINDAIKAGFTANIAPIGPRELFYRSEFKGIGIVAGHSNEYGHCLHNFASEPCQVYRDCINCEEQECVKGDAQKEANLRRLRDETEYLLKQAREALSEQEYGADVWVQHQTLTLERVKALLAIMEDSEVPDGTRIRLNVLSPAPVTNDGVRPITFHKSKPEALR